MICSDCIHYCVCENISDSSCKAMVNSAEVEKECREFIEHYTTRGEMIKELEWLNKKLDAKCDRCITRNKIDGMKEFAERVIKYIDERHLGLPVELSFSEMDVVRIIRKLLEEMQEKYNEKEARK